MSCISNKSITFNEISQLEPAQMLAQAQSHQIDDDRVKRATFEKVVSVVGHPLAFFADVFSGRIVSLPALPIGICGYFCKRSWVVPKNAIPLSKELIESNTDFSSEFKLKLSSLLDRVEIIRKKMKIEGNIDCYLNSEKGVSSASISTLFSKAIIFGSDFQVKQESVEAMDFVIGHELSHLKHSDSSKMGLMQIGSLLAGIGAYWYCPDSDLKLKALWLVSGLSHITENTLRRTWEKRCDIESMQVLRSSQGAASFFSNILKKNYLFQNASPEEIRKAYPTATDEEISTRKYWTLESGNDMDNSHPSLTDRLSAALESIPS